MDNDTTPIPTYTGAERRKWLHYQIDHGHGSVQSKHVDAPEICWMGYGNLGSLDEALLRCVRGECKLIWRAKPTEPVEPPLRELSIAITGDPKSGKTRLAFLLHNMLRAMGHDVSVVNRDPVVDRCYSQLRYSQLPFGKRKIVIYDDKKP